VGTRAPAKICSSPAGWQAATTFLEHLIANKIHYGPVLAYAFMHSCSVADITQFMWVQMATDAIEGIKEWLPGLIGQGQAQALLARPGSQVGMGSAGIRGGSKERLRWTEGLGQVVVTLHAPLLWLIGPPAVTVAGRAASPAAWRRSTGICWSCASRNSPCSIGSPPWRG
jgi:hypothetical protein